MGKPSIINLLTKMGEKLVNIGFVKNVLDRFEVDALIRPMITELCGANDASHELLQFKAKCLGICVPLFVFGVFIVLFSGLGLVEASYVVVISVGCGISPYFDLKKRITERRYFIKRGLPDFISRLVLLVEAGMTLSRGFEIASKSVEKGSPLYFEIGMTCNEIKNGVGEIRAYEQLAMRCRTIEVARFSSMLIQNLRKGNSELATLLRMVASECWNARKAHARKRGEEAAAKMLIPVALLLVAVLVVTAGPAMASIMNINLI